MAELDHPWQRVSGIVLAAVIVFVLDTTDASQLHRLWLPLALALAAYLMTRSLMAVAFATCALAAINTELEAADWIAARAYPGIALLSLLLCGGIVTQRFRQRIVDTHEARWAQRRQANKSSTDRSQPPSAPQ